MTGKKFDNRPSQINRLEQSVDSLARFPEENPNPVMRASPTGTLLYANTASRDLLNLWKMSTQDHFPTHLATQINDIFIGGETKSIETDADDAIFILDITPIPEAGYLNIYGIDVTETRQMRAARDTAEHADRAKSEFLANMSHEIRTPMNGIMGMAELLTKTKLDNKQKMFADVILKSSSALLTIINDILDFSKIGAGKLQIDAAPFSLPEAIEDVATLLSSNIRDKDVELIVRIAPTLPKFFIGDVGRIRQIITNIMGNAIKFTDKGHVLVDVTGKPTDENKYRLDFKIVDTGVGIPEDQRDRIFEKFSQVDGSATRKHQGTGLGLAIASSLIDLMGGKIGVDSEPGDGSTFWFNICLSKDTDEQVEDPIPVDVSGARILVVDDNDINLSILNEQMKQWGFFATSCSSGVDALNMMRSAGESHTRPDLIILDYQMPGMSGTDVVRKMRNEVTVKNIPVIILSSVDTAEHDKDLDSLLVQGRLIKPARSSLLLKTIIGVLQDHFGVASIKKFIPITLDKTDGDQYVEKKIPTIATAAPNYAVNTDPQKDSALDILIAEDNEVNQIIYEQVIKPLGFSYRIANDGREALDLYRTHRPKIILMDVSMPEMNGLEATQAIRSIEAERSTHTPIVGITAHALTGDMEKCLDAGMDDYLSKPLSPELLASKISDWFVNGTMIKKRI